VKALKGSRMGLGLLGIVEKEWDTGTSNQTNPISSSSSFFIFFKKKLIKYIYNNNNNNFF
jgi:hypothetical protein